LKKTKIAAYIIVVLLLAANLYMSFQMQGKLQQIEIAAKPKKSLPCESVPISWAVSHYECANSLLWAMNVTNVKFESPGTTNELLYNRAKQISTP
jgi:hypothetical protein